MVHPNSPFETPRANLDAAVVPGTPGTSGRASMAYMESLTSYFQLPSWGKNLFFLALLSLIPFIGPIVMIGYLGSQLVRQHLNGEHDLMEFSWDRFGDHLGRGVWAFLVGLVLVFVMLPIYGVFFGLVAAAGSANESLAAVVGIIGGLFLMVGFVVLGMASQPIALRAILTQSFGNAFDMAFVKSFVSKMWLEMLLSGLFIMAISIPLVLVGYLACFVGVYAAVALQYWAIFQLQRQLYEVFLFRGGEPVDIAPDLAANP